MKRIAIVIMFLLALLVLAGCSAGKVDSQKIAEAQIDNKMFFMVSGENGGSIYVDKTTKVMYWCSEGSYNYGTLTLLVNPDGTPRIWEG